MSREVPVVSVLMVTYNQKPYIAQAVESVLNQKTPFAYEVLIGDDGSRDGTDEILQRYAGDPRVHVVRREENMGASANLYDLQMRSRGKYLAYLEGDDFWNDPGKLAKQVQFLEAHPQYIACTHGCTLVDNHGEKLKKQFLPWIFRGKVYTVSDFRGVVLPGHLSTLVHRNVFLESRGAFEGIMRIHPQISDRSLCVLLASKGSIYQLADNMSCYRQVSNSGSHVTGALYHNNPARVWDDYCYTVKLERYACEVLHVDGRFKIHKKELFVSAMWDCILHPSKDSRRVLKQIGSDGHLLGYVLYVPYGVIRKICNRWKGV